MKNNSFVSAVVYCYNNENIIKEFINAVSKELLENFSNAELIVVNDYSNDNSVKAIKDAAKKVKGISITLLSMSTHYGIETAMNAGVDLSIGDFVYEFDSADIDYEIDLIKDLYAKCVKGFDIVSAVPNRKQKNSSKLFYDVFNKYSKTENKLKTETFRIISRRAINRIKNSNRTIPYRKPIYANCGLQFAYIEYTQIKEQSNTLDKGYRLDLAINSLVLFTNFGYKFSIAMVGAMLFVALFMIVYTIAIYLNGNPVEGWTTTIMFLSLAFFGLFAILAIVIKYLQIIVDLNFKLTEYNIESIEKLSK